MSNQMLPAIYHLIPRFVAGEWFVKSDFERNWYLRLLGDALKISDWRCIAYAVMSSHIHLCVVAGMMARADWLRNTHSPFGAWINERNERFGAVFADEMATWSVDPAEVGKVVAYIHNNPVRAGVVGNASESTWSSHRAYLGMAAPPRWLNIELGMALMKFDDAAAFDRFVNREAPKPKQAGKRRGRPKFEAGSAGGR